MNERSLISKVRGLFSDGKEPGPAYQSSWARLHGEHAPKERDLADFQKQLDDILSHYPTVVSGRVQLLDVNAIIDRLGSDNREKRRKHIDHIVKDCIEKRLTSKDVYTRYGDTSYVIVFAQLDRQGAKMKSLLMAEEISSRLLGEEEEHKLVEVKTACIKEDGKLLFETVPSLDALLDEFEHAPEAVPEETATNLDEVMFVFRPIWVVEKQIVSAFNCVPVVAVSKDNYMSGYGNVIDETDPESIFKLDVMIVRRVGEELRAMRAAKRVALISLPIHFETLATKKRRDAYLTHCAQFLTEFKDRVLFEILALPEGIPATRLSEFTACLKNHARSVLASFNLYHTDFQGYRSSGVHAVGMNVFHSSLLEKEIMTLMHSFVKAANQAGLKTYVHGINSISLNTIAVSCGFDYVDGDAIHSVANMVDGAYRLQIEDIYSNLT